MNKLSTLKSLIKFKINIFVVLLLVISAFFLGANSTKFISPTLVKAYLGNTHEIEGIKIHLTQAHLSNSIKVSQKSAQAPENKQFLVIFTDVENASSSAVQVPFGNWFRLEADGKKLAPLPLNASFTVPGYSTVEKQLVFVVDKQKKEFNLLTGDLGKEPSSVKIAF